MAAKSLHHGLTFIHSLFFMLYVFQAILATDHDTFSSKHSQSLSHDDGDDCYALFQFKQSISINESASYYHIPNCDKIAAWKLNDGSGTGSSDYCCLWDGVDCDDKGRVVSLDLSSSCLYGHINSTTTLFSLDRLRNLNLADNAFMRSSIPPEIGRLSQLTTLNLSTSAFSGQIPKEVLQLTHLASLDLSRNNLKLRSPLFCNLVENLTRLEELFLSDVHIFPKVPDVLSNFSSLRSVDLSDCELNGEIPAGIFHLPKLRYLNMAANTKLTGHIPEFHQNSPFEHLILFGTKLSGKLPASIGNLKSLVELDLGGCSFTGSPSPLANLSELTSLSFMDSTFDSWELPNWIGKLSKLNMLNLQNTHLHGETLASFANLTQLRDLYVSDSQLTGRVPTSLFNMTQLTLLDLSRNQLQGPIPSPSSYLNSLEFLDLANNHFHGTVDGNIFLNLTKLWYLDLGQNNISFVVTDNYNNSTLPKFQYLSLGSCNLTVFPDFLCFQDQLEDLYLENNGIGGQVPKCICNTSNESLGRLELSHNSLTGFDQHISTCTGLYIIGLSHNTLQGNLPVPPPNTIVYDVSNNRLTGEIPPLICQLVSLQVIDISNNNMTGNIPPCLGNLGNFFCILNLKANSFNGTIPNTYTHGSLLEMIDFSDNELEGPVPRSLVDCSVLQYLDLGRNHLYDMFPFWLGGLPELQVLILRSNEFHGQIESSIAINSTFPKLHVFDISANRFTGNLPRDYFKNWIAMKSKNANTEFLELSAFGVFYKNYAYSLVVTNKGLSLEYEHIREHLKTIDISSNQFRGEIPESIGNLQGLVVLNLSHNQFVGGIPSSIANLKQLESLDLSQNNLSGLIPQELVQLNFLESFNVSCNDLSGPIPQGNHLYTFPNDSFAGNPGLCGLPLSKRCGSPSPTVPTPPLPSIPDGGTDSDGFPSGVVDWIVISLGFTSGLVIGIIIGQHITTKHHEWFLETFGNKKMRNRQGGRISGRRARN